MSKSIGILNEVSQHDLRVALTPDVAAKAIKAGFEVLIEKSAGEKAYFKENDYLSVQAKVVDRKTVLNADYIGFIRTPSDEIINSLGKNNLNQTAVGVFNSFSNPTIGKKFLDKNIKAIDMAKLPRQLSMAQSMDALTSQNSVAGYNAVLLAANKYTGFFPMLTTAAGTIRPAKVLVLGAGIAGLQAIGTAKRLGAIVTAFDVREASIEEVESLGASFLDLSKYGASDIMDILFEGQGDGGYARKLTPEESQKQQTAIDNALKDFDIVITTAQVPGSKPPVLVTKNGVANMSAGSVIVDMGASALGGNVEGSKPEEEIEVENVKIIGAGHLSSASAKVASNLFARNLFEVINFFEKADLENKADHELLDMVITSQPSDNGLDEVNKNAKADNAERNAEHNAADAKADTAEHNAEHNAADAKADTAEHNAADAKADNAERNAEHNAADAKADTAEHNAVDVDVNLDNIAPEERK